MSPEPISRDSLVILLAGLEGRVNHMITHAVAAEYGTVMGELQDTAVALSTVYSLAEMLSKPDPNLN